MLFRLLKNHLWLSSSIFKHWVQWTYQDVVGVSVSSIALDRKCEHNIRTKYLASGWVARYDEAVVDEPALIKQAKRGDLEAFNRLILVYQSQVYNLALRLMGDSASASDATQEAFISAFRGIRRYRGGSFRAWLLRIVRNACYDEFRRRARRPTASLDDLSPYSAGPEPDGSMTLISTNDGPEKTLESAELAKAIQDCLDRLPTDSRILAVLIDVQGYDYKEAAAVIGKPIGTVKSRLSRTRAKLRDCLQGYRELLPSAFRLEDE